MDLHQLQAFDAIVLQGGFSKAARFLDISQPTISLRIQALEQVVGGALFVRGGSRLQLTELGRSFLPYARTALRAMKTGVDVAQETIRGKRGRVMVGTLPSLATGFFASALARLHSLHPLLDIAVHTGHNQQIAEMLYDGYVHVGLLTAPYFRLDVDCLLSLQEPLLFVTHVQHPLARRERVSIGDLEELGQPFFHIDWSLEVKQWQSRMVASQGHVIEVPPQTAYDLLMRGMGAALLTHSMVSADLRTGRLVALAVEEMPPLKRESTLVRFRRAEPLPMAVNEFVRVLREEAREYCSAC